MADIFTPEEKKTLRLAARVARSLGKKNIMIDIPNYDKYESQIEFEDFDESEVKESINTELLEYNGVKGLPEILYKFYKYAEENVEVPDLDIDYFRHQEFMIILSAPEQNLSLVYNFSYVGESESNVSSFTGDEAEEALSELDDMDATELTLSFDGGGDEGSLNYELDNGEDVPDGVEDWCYMKLSENHGGWETDEGSSGYFWFDLVGREVQLHYTDYESIDDGEVLLTISFAE
jgi:hypothetical protein